MACVATGCFQGWKDLCRDTKIVSRQDDAPSLAIDGLCRDRIPIVLCCDRDFFVVIGFSESSVATENDRPRVVTGFPCRDRA